MKLSSPVALLLATSTHALPKNIINSSSLSSVCSTNQYQDIASKLANYGLQDKGYSVTLADGFIEIKCTTEDACNKAKIAKKSLEIANLTSDKCTITIKEDIPNENNANVNLPNIAKIGGMVAVVGALIA